MALSAVPLTDSGVGSEIRGLEIGPGLGAEAGHELRRMWLDAGVIVIRGGGTSPEALLEVSRCLGDVELHPIEAFRMEGWPEIIELGNADGLTGPIYEVEGHPVYGRIPWHTDLAFTTRPNRGAALRMVRKSPHGGETGWIDTAMAWDELDASVQRHIETLDARYLFAPDLEAMRFGRTEGPRLVDAIHQIPSYPPVARPLVWTHPETGRRVLNLSILNIQEILGMPAAEGDALIESLIEHVLQPRFRYVHDWAENDIVAWDNFRMMHRAAGHPPDEIRVVQRTTLRGDLEQGHVLEDAGEVARA